MRLSLDRFGARVLRSRRAVRAPIWLYRHGLGWLAGSRILMLEHVGRRSGRSRYVCLEVVERPDPRSVIVVSGFGTTAQWYRNLRAHSDCHVTLGRRRSPARARFLTDDEMAAVLARYREVHPRAWRHLRGAIEQATGSRVDTLPGVRLTIRPPDQLTTEAKSGTE